MSLTGDDFAEFVRKDDDGEPPGDALAALTVDVETDAVAEVQELRERT